MLIDYIFILIIIALLIEKGYSYIKRRNNEVNYITSFRESLDLCSLPIITANHNKIGKINLLLDTGASSSFIDIDILKQYLEIPSEIGERELITGGSKSSILNLKVESTINIRDVDYKIEFLVCSLKEMINSLKREHGVTIHGIIGNDFLENHKYIIDYSDYKIYDRK